MSATDNWCTPKWLAYAIWPVDLDPCSNEHSHIQARRRVALPDDGLAMEWEGSTWVNPPYSAPLPWCRKAVATVAQRDCQVAMLLKLDPTTKWWAALQESRMARFFPFRKRLMFEQPGTKGMVANFPNILVLLHRGPTTVFGDFKDGLRSNGWLW